VPRRVLLVLAGLFASLYAVLLPTAASAAVPASATASAPASATASAPRSVSTDDIPAPMILIGTAGLSWSDVSPKGTPALWSLLRDGSSGTLSVRSVYPNTCPVDGWLGLSAGERAAAPAQNGGDRSASDPCPPVPTAENGVVPGWDTYVKAADATSFGAHLGTLGEQLITNGQCTQAVGQGAAVGAAYSTGAVARYSDFDPAQLTGLLSRCRVTLVDVGSLRDPEDIAPGEPAPGKSRAEQVSEIDARIGQVLKAAPSGSDVVVASMADAGQTPRLRLLAAKGPHYGPGTLYSPSTRQDGIAQAPDLTVTLLTAGSVPIPSELGGAALVRGTEGANSEAATADRLQHLNDLDAASYEVHGLVPPFFDAVVAVQLAIYILAAVVWRRDFGSPDQRLRMLRIVRRIAVVAASIPAATFLANLAPWWRFPVPMVALVASVALFVAVIACVALLGPWGRWLTGPMGAVSVATMLVLGVDVLFGSRLQISSLMGLQPVVGGRFYGMGNVTFALFATAALLLAVAVSGYYVRRGRTRAGAVAALLIGLVAVVIDGAPAWGADGGGPPALLPGLAYLVLAILGVRVTWKRGLLIGLATVGLFLLVAFLDWLRPVESRSHLGRFMQSLIDGNALDIIVRKLEQNLSILTSSVLALLVPIALAFVIYILARPTSWGAQSLRRSFEACPTLRPGLVALLITMTIGFFINDSGVAIPANGAIIAVPLIIAVSVRALEDEAKQSASTRALRRG
jgi:hypothetical protein